MPCLRLNVPTLVGGAQGPALEARLRAEKGVYAAFVHCGEKFVEIDFEDDEVTIARLLDVVRHAGYEARVAG
jgi:hypothetical protein